MIGGAGPRRRAHRFDLSQAAVPRTWRQQAGRQGRVASPAIVGLDHRRYARRRPASSAADAAAPAVRRRRRRVAVGLVVVGVYAALAVVAYLPVLPLDNAHVPAAKLNDSISIAWFLDWVATAIRHGHDPLVSSYMEHPVGVNLAVNQSMPLAGVLGAPVSWLLGPFAAFNLWLRLAFVASAGSMYLALRRLGARAPSAFLGGLLYGFSPFIVGHELISPNFSFAPVPPLLLVVVDDLVRADRCSARRDGLALGGLVVAQLYLNPELLADCVVAIGAAVLVVIAHRARRDGLARLWRLGAGLAWAMPVVATLGAPFAWAYLAGPQRPSGPVVPLHYLVVFRTDLAGLVVPGINQRLGPPGLIALGTSYTGYAINETGVYLGIPLLLLVACLVVRLRRDRLAVLSALVAGFGLLLSLGPSLVVDNHHTGIWLPWSLFLHVPVLQSAEAIRFVLLTYLGVAVLFAIGLEDLAKAATRRFGARGRALRHVSPGGLVVAGLATVSLVPLVPRWPYASEPTAVPPYFTSRAVRAIPAGAVALTYPYAQPGQVTPEVWQMASGYRFRLVGGYAYVADNGGIPFGSPPLRPRALYDLLVGADTGGSAPVPAAGPATVAAIRSGLRRTGAQVFLLHPVGDRPGLVVRELTAALGRPPVASGGILAWYHVRADLARLPRARPLRAGGRSR